MSGKVKDPREILNLDIGSVPSLEVTTKH